MEKTTGKGTKKKHCDTVDEEILQKIDR